MCYMVLKNPSRLLLVPWLAVLPSIAEVVCNRGYGLESRRLWDLLSRTLTVGELLHWYQNSLSYYPRG